MKKRIVLILLLAGSCLFGQNIYRHIPEKADTSKKYIFYLHGRIIEEEGLRPKSEKYGIYEYEKILDSIAEAGFVVISEPRKKNTDIIEYAKTASTEIDSLIKSGVPVNNITIIGASKGGGIAVAISSYLKNENLKFVIMAICNPDMKEVWEQKGIRLWGKVLYMYDYKDEIAGSCNDCMEILKSEGLKEYKEIKLETGLGHGILYTPKKEWLIPTLEWAKNH
jgi:hypothetical protein